MHVDYYQLVDDPAAVMPTVFEAVDLEWTPEVDERVRTWREENPKGKRGTHEYDLTDYGLERETVAEAFAVLHRALRHPERVLRELVARPRPYEVVR